MSADRLRHRQRDWPIDETNAAGTCDSVRRFYGGWSDCEVKGARAKRAAMLGIRIRLLGEPALDRPGQASQRLTDKDAALIAKLALDGPQPRTLLCALLWPDATAANAALSLRQRATRLTRMAGGKLLELGTTVRLDAAVEVDAAAPALLPPATLLEAGSLLAGREFGLQDELDRWVMAAREQVANACADALAAQAEALERDGRLHEALSYARKMVELVPLGEHGARRVMRLHYLRNDRAAAQEAYWRLASALRDELGLRPSAETSQLMQTVELAEADAALRSRPVAASLLRPPVLVGRDHAWKTMSACWEQPAPFVLIGEAGIGKTRLLDDFVRGVGGCVVERAHPGEEQSSLALLGRLLLDIDRRFQPAVSDRNRAELARIRPEFGTEPNTPSVEQLVRHATEQLLIAAMDKGLHAVVLDDLHYADPSTIEALRWLSACRSLAALRWGLASRPSAARGEAGPLMSWLGDSQRPVRIDLLPLTRPELSALLSSLALPALLDAGVEAHLYRHAGGHPFYTLATLQHALSQGADLRADILPRPTSVHALLDLRLRDLPEPVQKLLRVAAIAGPDLRADRIAHLLDCQLLDLSEAWAALETAGVLVGESFSHDLMLESALRSVPVGVARALHRRFAEILTQDAHAQPSSIARHWEDGEGWPQAACQWQAAAHVARRSACLSDQIELFDRAANCFERAGDADGRFDALFARLEAVQLRHGGTAVLTGLPSVEALANNGLRRLRCRLARAEAWIDGEHAEGAAEAGAAVQEAAFHPALLPQAYALQAQALVQGRHFDAARQTAAQAMAAADAGGDALQRLRALDTLSYVHYADGLLAQALTWQAKAVRLADELGHRSEAAAGAGHLAALLAAIGDVPATRSQALVAARAHHDIGLARSSTFGIVNSLMLGMAAGASGHYDEALGALLEAVSSAGVGTAPPVFAKARIALAGLWLTLGQPDAARALLDELPDAMGPGMSMQIQLLRARAAQQAGLSPQRYLSALSELDQKHPDLPLVMSAHFDASYQGDARRMVERLGAVRRECEAKGLEGTGRTMQWRELVRGLECADATDRTSALRHARQLHDHVGSGLSAKCHVPQVWATLALAYAYSDETLRSQACIDAGRAWIEHSLARTPPEYRDGYMKINRVNRLLLAGEEAGASGAL